MLNSEWLFAFSSGVFTAGVAIATVATVTPQVRRLARWWRLMRQPAQVDTAQFARYVPEKHGACPFCCPVVEGAQQVKARWQ